MTSWTKEFRRQAPAVRRESGNKTRKRRKLIRLDDLIPKQDVKGGHQLLFGTTDTVETANNNRRE
jgi:hypothetical protein